MRAWWVRRRNDRRAELTARILIATTETERSLYEITRRVGARPGRVHPIVWELHRQGRLTSRWVDQGPDRPARRFYRA